jgi:hypothetical protein
MSAIIGEAVITYGFKYQGAPGQTFMFALVDVRRVEMLPDQGGVLVFARHAPEPLWVGAVESIYAAITRGGVWGHAKECQGATQVYFHETSDALKREAIARDLVASYRTRAQCRFQ